MSQGSGWRAVIQLIVTDFPKIVDGTAMVVAVSAKVSLMERARAGVFDAAASHNREVSLECCEGTCGAPSLRPSRVSCHVSTSKRLITIFAVDYRTDDSGELPSESDHDLTLIDSDSQTSRCTMAPLLSYLISDGRSEARRLAYEHVTSCSECLPTLLSDPMDNSFLILDDDRLKDLFSRRILHFVSTRTQLLEIFDAFDTAFLQHPKRTLLLADLAITVANKLAAKGLDVTELEATAWTCRASALMASGNGLESLSALEVAKAKASQLRKADIALANIAFTESRVLREIGRTTEALESIRIARATFIRNRDRKRAAVCYEAEGAVLYRMDEFDWAINIFDELLVDPTMQSEDARARLFLSKAHCTAALGRAEYAAHLFDDAEALFTKLNMTANVLRAKWGKARLHARKVDDDQSLDHLWTVWLAFDTEGMKPEWFRSGLDLAEQLLNRNQVEEMQRICDILRNAANTTIKRQDAVDALQLLRSTAISGEITSSLIQSVRSYFEQLDFNAWVE